MNTNEHSESSHDGESNERRASGTRRTGTLFNPPLAPPRNGYTYEFIVTGRVSDPRPGKQDERSLDDQQAMWNQRLHDNIDAPYNVTVVNGKGSGESLEREEYQRLIDLVESRKFDALFTEDLGRVVRRIHAHLFCELCEDTDTRLLAPNDHVDTAQPGWREASIFSAFHHERSNRDTSERIKRTHRNRFANGGCLRDLRYGWFKAPGTKSDADLQKDPAAEPIYREWFRMLDEDDATFADVARWLRKMNVPLPPGARGDQWTGRLVANHTFNPQLKGIRERNRRTTRRVNKSGRYRSRKAPPELLLTRKVPHMAYFSEAYYDRVVGKVRDRNRKYRRTDDPAQDPCLNRPKKLTRYPGRVTFCGICGRPFVWGGHGQTDHMMCTGAREYGCWNGATFDGTLASERIASAVLAEVQALPGFDPAFLAKLEDEGRRLDTQRQTQIADLTNTLARCERGITNLVAFIREGQASASIGDELRRLELEKARVAGELEQVRQTIVSAVRIPPLAEIQALVQGSIAGLSKADPEFAVVMRKLAPRIVVFPARLCDGGAMVLRARFRLEVANLLPDRRTAELLRQPLARTVTVDLFDPPQRELFRQRILAARALGQTERNAAAACGITITAAQRAAALQRKMDELKLADPYVPVTQPPEDLPKLRRHHHADYRFEPLPGAGEL